MLSRTRLRPLGLMVLGIVFLMLLPFVHYAWDFGWRGFTRDLTGISYIYTSGGRLPNTGIFARMMLGALVTLMAPLQLVSSLRNRWPAIHRASGYLIFTAAMLTAGGELVYIAVRGTIGGALMDIGFSLYGACLMVAAIMTVYHARRREKQRHRQWALRFFILVIASWLYRVHYGVWHAMTGGLASEKDFSGLFDQIQNFAFFVPYLIALESYFRSRRHLAALIYCAFQNLEIPLGAHSSGA
jgi:hypothetical protein